MAQYAISIEKEVPWQGGPETFSNAYTFNTGAIESFDDLPIIERLVALEKAVHGSQVQFRTARSYGIGGPNITNVMREIVDLSGTGALTESLPFYRECAILIQFELPRSALLRRRRIGRKWLHTCCLPPGVAGDAQATVGSAPLSTAQRNFYLTNYATPLVNENWSGGAEFASGDDAFTSPSVYPYVEHRQFHRS